MFQFSSLEIITLDNSIKFLENCFLKQLSNENNSDPSKSTCVGRVVIDKHHVFLMTFQYNHKELYVIGNPKIHKRGGINTGCVSQAQIYSRRAQSIKQHCLLLLLHSMFIIMIVSNNLSGVTVPGTIFLCGSLDREALDKLAL